MTLYDFFFGCTHKHLSFPQSQRKQKKPGHYVVCLDCGKEFGYDWDRMRVLKGEKAKQEPIREPNGSSLLQRG